ncbi:hypothetical protein ACFL5I_01465 [Planctomycetota bacterium]
MIKINKLKYGCLILLFGIIVLVHGGCKPWIKGGDGLTSGSSAFSSFVPPDGATSVPITQQLSWAAVDGATSYDVYFGTSDPPAYQTNTTGTTYDPGKLTVDTVYCWRVDSKNTDGTTTGPIRAFRTQSSIDPPGGDGG